jgi:hypothetical protein
MIYDLAIGGNHNSLSQIDKRVEQRCLTDAVILGNRLPFIKKNSQDLADPKILDLD